jgi:serine/threonine-protein kinase
VSVPPLKKLEGDKAVAMPPPALDAPKPAGSADAGGAPLGPPPSSEGHGNGQRTTAYVLGGVAGAGIIVGSIFGLRAISKNKDAETHCPSGYRCDDADGPALADDARSAARVSNIAFGVGAAALVGGAVLFFTSPKSSQVAYGVSPTGIVVRGSFQ